MPSISLFAHSSNDAHVTDVDGTRFLDLCMGSGSIILGHAHPIIQKAITERVAHGWQLGLENTDQTELAQLVQAAGPANERVILCNSSKEAISLATRAARAFSGKHLVGVLTGSEHDLLAGDPVNDNLQVGEHFGRGLPPASDHGTIVFPYGHTAVFDLIQRRKNDLAAIIVEPTRGNEASTVQIEWLHQLAKTCRDADVLLILDEVLSGFRVAYGGTQELFGLLPDLVVYGGIIGGGLSLGAVAGRTDILRTPSQSTSSRSTFRGEAQVGSPISVAAGVATLSYLRENSATLYPALNKQSEAWVKNFNAFTTAKQLPVEMKSIGSMFRIVFHGTHAGNRGEFASDQLTTETAFNVLTLNRGVLTHASHRGFLSLAHTEQNLNTAMEAFKDSLLDVRDDGFFSNPPHH